MLPNASSMSASSATRRRPARALMGVSEAARPNPGTRRMTTSSGNTIW